MALNVKRFEEFVDGCTILHLDEPIALRTTLVLIETHILGVIVMNLSPTHGNDGANACLLGRVVVHATLAQSRHTHLIFKHTLALTLEFLIKPNAITLCNHVF